MADEGYIRNLRETLQARSTAEEERTRKENRDTEIIKAEAVKFWISLKAWLVKATSELNQGLADDLVTYSANGSPDTIKLRCNIGQDRSDLKVTFFNLFGGQISAVGEGFEAKFRCEIEGRNTYWVDEADRLDKPTLEEMGKRILNAAVKA